MERPDGTRVHFLPFPTPLHDPSGALVGAVNMLVDITERKASRGNPAAAQRNPRAAGRGAHAGDDGGLRPAAGQRRAVPTVGPRRDRLCDLHARSRRLRDELEPWRRADQGLCRRGDHRVVISRSFIPRRIGRPGSRKSVSRRRRRTGKYEAEGWRVRKDGTAFWANAVIDAIHDESGQLVGFAKITRDLTERRAAEEQLASGAKDGSRRPTDRRSRP